jgi:excisionase family DNA binding protein
MKDKNRDLLSVEDAARRLGLRPVTVRKWVSGRKLGCVRLGRRVLLSEHELERFIATNTVPALPGRARR